MIPNRYHEPMRIGEERKGDVSVLRIEGELDAGTLPDAAGAVDECFKGLRTRIVFNLSGVPMVTSSAISFLIDAAQRARRHGGDAVISEPTELLRKSLKVLDLDRFFEIFDEEAHAVTHFREIDLEDTARPGELPQPMKDWREKLKFWRKQSP